VAAEFVDHWTALPDGPKARKAGEAGWSKTYRNRCRQIAERPRNPKLPQKATIPELMDRLQFEGRAGR
jgi:hypothetical protein